MPIGVTALAQSQANGRTEQRARGARERCSIVGDWRQLNGYRCSFFFRTVMWIAAFAERSTFHNMKHILTKRQSDVGFLECAPCSPTIEVALRHRDADITLMQGRERDTGSWMYSPTVRTQGCDEQKHAEPNAQGCLACGHWVRMESQTQC